MKLYRAGEKSKVACEICKQLRSTTFRECDVPLSSGKGSVADVLVAVCDYCDNIVSIPQQSVPRIKEVIQTSRHALETRIPRHLIDALILACYELGFGANESKQTVLFRFYLKHVAGTKLLSARLKSLCKSEEAQGKSNARFSIKLNDELYKLFLKLEEDTHLNKAEIVKGIIVQMKIDLLDEQKQNLKDELREVLLVAG